MADDSTGFLRREIDRVTDRLRSLGPHRLAARATAPATAADRSANSVADEAHRLAQLLADAAADLADEPRRGVPRLGDHAVADQVAVTGRELIAALNAHGVTPSPGIVAAVAELKRALP